MPTTMSPRSTVATPQKPALAALASSAGLSPESSGRAFVPRHRAPVGARCSALFAPALLLGAWASTAHAQPAPPTEVAPPAPAVPAPAEPAPAAPAPTKAPATTAAVPAPPPAEPLDPATTSASAEASPPEPTASAASAEASPPQPTASAAPAEPELSLEAETDPAMPPVVEAPPEPAAPDPIAFEPSVNFGVGLRVAYVLDPDVDGANFGQAMGTNIRPYISGTAHKYLKFEANLDSTFAATAAPGDLGVDDNGFVVDADGDGQVDTARVATVRLLDAVLKFEVNDLLNVWMGHFLPPTDRANLSGPYYQNAWNYPVQTNLYPALYAGRHDGVAYWGQVEGGAFKWQVGMFDVTGGDNPLAAGRLVLNLLEPEPGYYNSSTYYGSKDVLAIGAVAQYQKSGDTASGTGLDGSALSGDVLFEKELDGAGTFSAEGAYYNFKGTDQGQSFWGLLGYLLPGKQGIGSLQGVARMQYAMPEVGDDAATLDAGIHYIINGHNARLALNYQHMFSNDDRSSDQLVTLGGQLQL